MVELVAEEVVEVVAEEVLEVVAGLTASEPPPPQAVKIKVMRIK